MFQVISSSLSKRNHNILCIFCLFFIYFLISNKCCAKEHDWLYFSSTSGFNIKYPRSWYLMPSAVDHLSISSSARKVEAVIIPRHAALISFHEIPAVQKADYLKYFMDQNPHDQIVRTFSIICPKKLCVACRKIFVIDSLDEVAPGSFLTEENMYCSVGGRFFVLTFSHWKDTGNKNGYSAIAMHMLHSLYIK